MTYLPKIALLLLPVTAAAQTAVFWASGPVPPHETVLLTGHFPAPMSARIAEYTLKSNDKNWQERVVSAGKPAKLLKAKQTALWFQLPDEADGVHAYRISQDGQKDIFGRVNLPEIWWTLSESPIKSNAVESEIEKDAASPGATLHILGRCLSNNNAKPTVTLTNSGGIIVHLEVTASNPYSVEARLPPDIPQGPYKLYVQATENNPDTASAGTKLSIHPKKTATLPILRIADFGALGNGTRDDTAAFAAALTRAAKIGGAEIRIPPGAFVLSASINIPESTYLTGESPEQTMLAFKDTSAPPPAWISGTRFFGLTNLSVYCGNHRAIIASGQSGDADTTGHVRMTNIRIVGSAFRKPASNAEIADRMKAMANTDGQGYEAISLSGSDILISNSYVKGTSRPILLQNASEAILRHNTFAIGFKGWFAVNNAQNVINENNEFSGADLMATGGSYATNGPGTHCENIYTAHNRFQGLLAQDREAMTSDGGGAAYLGPVKMAPDQSILLIKATDWRSADWKGAAVAIVDGYGVGQWRKINRRLENKIYLDSPFEVPPDDTSTILITHSQAHWTFYENTFEECGVSIQIFGRGFEHILSNNVSKSGGGFTAESAPYFGPGLVMNTQIMRNRIAPGLNYYLPGNEVAGPSAIVARAHSGTNVIGTVLRDNVIEDQAYLRLQQDDPGKIKAALVEGNELSPIPSFRVYSRPATPNLWVDTAALDESLILPQSKP